MPDDDTSSIPGSDIFTQEGQDKLGIETNKALQDLIGKSVGDVGAFDPQGEVDQETIDKIKEQQQADVQNKIPLQMIHFLTYLEKMTEVEKKEQPTTTQVEGADTPAKKPQLRL